LKSHLIVFVALNDLKRYLMELVVSHWKKYLDRMNYSIIKD